MGRDYRPVNEQAVNKALDSDNFVHKGTCAEGLPIHTFRTPGEQLEGRLRPCRSYDRADRAKTAELWFFNSQGVEQGVAIRLTKNLWGTVQKNRLWGSWIRVTFKGSIRRPGLRYCEKIYLVEVDKGAITENFEGVKNYAARSHKPRAGKIRRPEPVTGAA